MNVPKHVAIILDGNGRWAKRRGLARNVGHYQGGVNLFKIANKANSLGIKYLTVYAFSTENWNRPKEEVDYLMEKPIEFLKDNYNRLGEITYKIKFVGRRSKFNEGMIETIDTLENKTKDNKGMTLQIAFDYGAKEELINAVKNTKVLTEENIRKNLYVKEDVDLLIRTSGEKRLSNFLLWQSSYAELKFVRKHWPSFKERDLIRCIKWYNKRNRRFGKL